MYSKSWTELTQTIVAGKQKAGHKPAGLQLLSSSETPKGCQNAHQDRRGWTAHTWADFTLEWPSGWKRVSWMWNICQQSHFLYKQSWSSFHWEGMEFTSILAHNYEKLRSGTFPSEQAIFVMEKSQPLHRSAPGICEKGSRQNCNRRPEISLGNKWQHLEQQQDARNTFSSKFRVFPICSLCSSSSSLFSF